MKYSREWILFLKYFLKSLAISKRIVYTVIVKSETVNLKIEALFYKGNVVHFYFSKIS